MTGKPTHLIETSLLTFKLMLDTVQRIGRPNGLLAAPAQRINSPPFEKLFEVRKTRSESLTADFFQYLTCGLGSLLWPFLLKTHPSCLPLNPRTGVSVSLRAETRPCSFEASQAIWNKSVFRFNSRRQQVLSSRTGDSEASTYLAAHSLRSLEFDIPLPPSFLPSLPFP